MDKFFFIRRRWKGQQVVRAGPSTELFDLFIIANDSILRFIMEDDLRNKSKLAAIFSAEKHIPRIETVEGKHMKLENLEIGGSVSVKPTRQRHDFNPTRKTPCQLTLIGSGKAVILLDKDGFKKFHLESKEISGTWLAIREKSTNIWELRRSSGPRLEKSDTRSISIFKTDEEKQLVWGVVLEPNTVDTQGHSITPEEIQRALHYFMENSQIIDKNHEVELSRNDAAVVEAFQAPTDIHWPVGDSVVFVPAGSWVQVTKIKNPEIWKAIKNGEINAYSIRGFGKLLDKEVQ